MHPLDNCAPILPGGLRTLLRFAVCSSGLSRAIQFVMASAMLVVIAVVTSGQQPNPVDRKVTNPMTDTPNVNPLTQDQPVRQRPARRTEAVATDQLRVDATTQTVSGPEKARVFVYEGNVDARIGTYRLQA